MKENLPNAIDSIAQNKEESSPLIEVQESNKNEEDNKKEISKVELCQLIYYDFSLK